MSDPNFSAFDDPADPAPDGSPRLPGGISIQAAATGLLIIVLLAILWLFFGPTSDAPVDLPTATAVAGATPSLGSGTAVSVTGAGTPGADIVTPGAVAAGGTPVAGQAAGSAGTAVPLATSGAASGVLAVDTFVRISSTDTYGMRLRFGAGLDTATIRIADEGETMRIVGGPETGDGYTWWRLQDQFGNIGWAAQEYLSPTSTPTSWSPPAASPTFDAQSAVPDDAEQAVETPSDG